MTLCLAGKNSIAVNCLVHLLKSEIVSKKDLFVIPVEGDIGVDTWTKSLRKEAEMNGVSIVNIEEMYGIEDLVFISVQYDKIIDITKFSTSHIFNIHFSFLPSYKGMYTSILPILHGQKKTGVTLHKIDSGIDTGDIVDQIEFEIPIYFTSRDLYLSYMLHGEKIFKDNINCLLGLDYDTQIQGMEDASYYSKKALEFNASEVDFNKKTSLQIHNNIRAFIFKEYQLPLVLGRQIIKSTITNELIKRNTVEKKDDCIIVSGIDGYKIILDTL